MTLKTRSEKRSEDELSELLKSENFNSDCIYYSPNENAILKDLFQDCSKTGDKYGIPDRIYFDNETLIIFECKATNINKANKDIEHYIKNLKDCKYKIFGVAFVNNTNYKIIGTINNILNLETFNLVKNNILINQESMNKEISNIHNYIRNNTKISNTDKPFFIACILISLKNETFINIINNYTKEDKDIYILIKELLLKYSLDESIFTFIKNNLDNKHLFHIIKMVLNIYQQNPTIDLLNVFYHEFVKYSNTDSKILGIVLTPEHIVKLMVELLDIKKDDTILDLCTGTGSFLLEASKYQPKKLIGCEYENKLYGLLQCNIILRDIKNATIYKEDCFKKEFKATKSIINPPYSTKGENELDFIIKQLDSIPEYGIAISIIPITVIGKYSKQRNKILSISKVKRIVKCNPKLFYPDAAVETLIIILEKTNKGHNFIEDEVEYTDYSNDEIIINKHIGKEKTEKFEERYHEIKQKIDCKKLIKEKDEWWHSPIKINNDISIQDIKMQKINIEINKLNQIKNVLNSQEKKLIKFENTKEFTFEEIFNIYTCKRTTLKYVKSNPGRYPYISASDKNNGITGYTNKFTHDGLFLSVVNSGSVCSTFIQTGKFCSTDSIILLQLKKNNNLLKDIGIYFILLIEKLKSKYSFNYAFRLSRLKEEKLLLPYSGNEIDLELLKMTIKNL